MREWWWLSTKRMTMAVETTNRIVTNGPPVVRKFIGQPSYNLGAWMRKQGGFRAVRLP